MQKNCFCSYPLLSPHHPLLGSGVARHGRRRSHGSSEGQKLMIDEEGIGEKTFPPHPSPPMTTTEHEVGAGLRRSIATTTLCSLQSSSASDQLCRGIAQPPPLIEEKVAYLDKSSANYKFWRSSSSSFSLKSKTPKEVKLQQLQTPPQNTNIVSLEKDSEKEPEEGPYDIFETPNEGLANLSQPLHENKKEVECAKNASGTHFLRSGMLLLKNFISHTDQVKIVNKCRELDIGCGGFYRPGYTNGAKLRLQMMCLGMDWDLQSRSYNNFRLFDHAMPPEIPGEFKKMVHDALHAAYKFLRQSTKNVNEIPMMSPDICIVNFYENSGKLGLHQDKDESKKSIEEGLPVVSFSIGDSAVFLYTDSKAEKAEKVTLESGDVLIFGGDSRLVFHGVSHILPGTAPELLINETSLRPGRLNLTFRKL